MTPSGPEIEQLALLLLLPANRQPLPVERVAGHRAVRPRLQGGAGPRRCPPRKTGVLAVWLRLKRIVLADSGLLYLATSSYSLVTHEMAGQERLLGFLALGFSILSGFGLRYGSRWVRAEGRTRTTLGVGSTILSVGWFTCFMLLILPHLAFTISQLVVALLWALVPMIASGAFAVGLEESKGRMPCMSAN
jgi:hypothetical protein